MAMASGIRHSRPWGQRNHEHSDRRMQQTGTFMIGGNYLPKELNRFNIIPETIS